MHERGVCILNSVTDFKNIFLTLTPDFKVISIFLDFCCNLHMLYDYWANINMQGQKMKNVFAF